jgi:hypothetical protein
MGSKQFAVLTMMMWLCFGAAHAQDTQPLLSMTIQPNQAGSINNNFRLSTNTGFSVAYDQSRDTYNLYSTSYAHAWKWNAPDPVRNRYMVLFFDTLNKPSEPPERNCYFRGDPRSWSSRCVEAIGLFWKKNRCGTNPTEACELNNKWNAYPGTSNVTSFPSPQAAPIWPKWNDYGTSGYTPIITKDTINAVALRPAGTNCTTGSTSCPPKSGNHRECHLYNPDEYSSGAANAKVVQVKFADGTIRWFMAMNKMIHHMPTPTSQWSTLDKWQILWASSADGKTWTVHPQILFRSVSESFPGYDGCGQGFLVTDMYVDDGYFYMLFNEATVSARSYLVRSRIDPINPKENLGYTQWELAANPIRSDGTYTWKPLTLGVQQNFTAMQAYEVMKSANGGLWVKQSAIARVFSSSAQNSASRYVGVTLDGFDAKLSLWSTTDLSKPFVYQSDVSSPAGFASGLHGWEFGFTHYVDNTPQTPRIHKNAFDFWMIGRTTNPNVAGLDEPLVLNKFTAYITGF